MAREFMRDWYYGRTLAWVVGVPMALASGLILALLASWLTFNRARLLLPERRVTTAWIRKQALILLLVGSGVALIIQLNIAGRSGLTDASSPAR